MTDYEKLGAFYLGRIYDPEKSRVSDENLLYDAKDLTTHDVCVGMTGSGKTGLCVSLLEEAALEEKLGEFEGRLESVRSGSDDAEIVCEELAIRARKSDLVVERVALVWTPRRV